jgi:hypothetical protein
MKHVTMPPKLWKIWLRLRNTSPGELSEPVVRAHEMSARFSICDQALSSFLSWDDKNALTSQERSQIPDGHFMPAHKR